MPDQVERETPPGTKVGDALQHQRAAMTIARGFDLRQGQPGRPQDAAIEPALRLMRAQFAAKGKTQLSDVA